MGAADSRSWTTALVVVAYTLFWIGWRAELYTGTWWYGVGPVASLAVGIVVARWWAIALCLVPAALCIGVTDDGGVPAFLVIVEFVAPSLAIGLAVGVGIARVLRRAGHVY